MPYKRKATESKSGRGDMIKRLEEGSWKREGKKGLAPKNADCL